MANVNSISSNSYSSGTSLYGNRNVLTGLASGMDTETMIQNSVTGYQTKISSLQQEQTKLEWKQDAYRDLVDQMYNITQKYTSYTSKTNLASNAFFTNATTTTTNGKNADAISATGTPKSDIQINAVTQLATSARYAVDASALKLNTTAEAAASKAVNWSSSKDIGQLSGTLSLKYDTQYIDITFDESDSDIQTVEDLQKAIEKKLKEIKVKTTKDTVTADELIKISADEETNQFTFTVNRSSKADDGSSVYINSVSGNLSKLLGANKPATTNIEDKVKNTSFTVPDMKELVKTQSTAEYLVGKSVEFTLDGTTKTVKIGDLFSDTEKTQLENFNTRIAEIENKLDKGEYGEGETGEGLNSELDSLKDRRSDLLTQDRSEQLKADLQTSLDKAFGKGKITVGTDAGTGGLRFDVAEGSGSTLRVASNKANEMLGIGKGGVSNYFNTSNTLGNLLSQSELDSFRIAAKGDSATFRRTGSGSSAKYYDADNNLVQKADDGNWYQADENGKFLYDVKINDTSVGKFTKDSALESVMTAINSSAEAGVKVSYSNLTSQFVFTANDTGSGSRIDFGDGLAKRLFQETAAGGRTISDVFGTTGDVSFQFGASGMDVTGVTSNMTMKELVSHLNSQLGSTKLAYDEESDSFSIASSSKYNSLEEINVTVNGSKTTLAELFKETTATRTAGQDAIVNATVNGKELSLTRADNSFDMDGMKITLKDTFSAIDEETGKVKSGDAVTFTTSSNADEIVDVIKSFVEDVNKLMKDVHDAYATQPLKKSSSKNEGYMPLTDEDKADMSESAVKAYEEKAKTGLLFGDTDLSQLYSKLLDTVQSFGSDRIAMEAIGLKTTYSGGVTQIDLNEKQLRSMLESDPDKVRTVFTKTKEGGSASDGLIANLKSTLNTYGSTSSGTPGLLVRKAGTKLSSVSLLNNNLQKQIDNLNTQIESWQTKLSDKIDYYTRQFTQLEKLMSQMNNQSSMLADLMGY